MVINTQAIQAVTQDDIGRPVSCQYHGVPKPWHGTIAALSYIDGKVFVKYPHRDHHKLEDLCNLRWGHVEGWIK